MILQLQETSKGTGRRRSFSWARGEERWASSKPSSCRVEDSQFRPISRRLQMQGYWRSAQQTQSTALFTCCQRADLEGVTWYREQSASADGASPGLVPASFPPLLRRVEQREEGPEERALLQLRHPHQLQNQESSYEPQDVSTGPGACRRPHVQHHWSQSDRRHRSQTRHAETTPTGSAGDSPRESMPLLFRNTLAKR